MASMYDNDSNGENDFLGFDTSDFPTRFDWDFPTVFDWDFQTGFDSETSEFVDDDHSDPSNLSDSDADSNDTIETSKQTWSKNVSSFPIDEFRESSGATFSFREEAREIELFQKFFPNHFLAELVIETNRYAAEFLATKPDPHWIPIQLEEFKADLDLLVLLVVPNPSVGQQIACSKYSPSPKQ